MELYEKGVRRKQSHPLFFRILRLFGVELRLPHYSEPKNVFIYTSIYFFVLIGGLMWLVQHLEKPMPLALIFVVALLFGVLCGAIMAWLNVHNKKKFELTDWDDLKYD